jgi:hypothetical protein
MEKSDVVAVLTISRKTGDILEIPVARREDPVDALDKYCSVNKIALTDGDILQCKISDPAAITAKACEAVVSVLQTTRQRTRRTSESN